MSAKRTIDLVKYFLIDSPAAQARSLNNILPLGNQKLASMELPTDKQYATYFLNRLQSLPPVAFQEPDAHSMLYSMLYDCTAYFPIDNLPEQRQIEQLFSTIQQLICGKNQNLTTYYKLEQLFIIANPKSINQIKAKLQQLFKFLLSQRDQFIPQEIQMEANIQLSRAILQAVSKTNEHRILQSGWKELEAKQKLLRAKSYRKKGLKQMALNNLKQICADQAAPTQTRLQALDVLCADSEQLGDTSLLQCLMNMMQSRGEKKYEEYIRDHIARIKNINSNIYRLA